MPKLAIKDNFDFRKRWWKKYLKDFLPFKKFNFPSIVYLWRSEHLEFCVTTDVHLVSRSDAKLGLTLLLHLISRVFLGWIRQTVLYIMTETERLSSWVYLYDTIYSYQRTKKLFKNSQNSKNLAFAFSQKMKIDENKSF